MLPSIHLGNSYISTYDLSIYIGFFAAAWYGYHQLVFKEKIGRFQVVLFLIFLFFAQWVGGGIIPFLHRWHLRGSFPADLIWGGAGRYWHSVFTFGILGLILYTRMMKWNTLRILDITGVAIGIMSPIGKIGCFLTGCCEGKPTDLPWGIQFPFSDEKVHPTQLYQLAIESLIVLPLILYIQKNKKYNGQTFFCYLMIYSFFRFVIEFLRTNPPALWGLTHAQVYSLLLVTIGGALMYWKHQSLKKR